MRVISAIILIAALGLTAGAETWQRSSEGTWISRRLPPRPTEALQQAETEAERRAILKEWHESLRPPAEVRDDPQALQQWKEEAGFRDVQAEGDTAAALGGAWQQHGPQPGIDYPEGARVQIISFDVWAVNPSAEGGATYAGICNYRVNGIHKQKRFKE